jgi:hypothetical protein
MTIQKMTQNNGRTQSNNRLGMRTAPTMRGPIEGTLAIVAGTALLVVGLAFSLVIMATVAVVAAIGLGILWWKTRGIRKQIREQMRSLYQPEIAHGRTTPSDIVPVVGDIIEGEIIREERARPKSIS